MATVTAEPLLITGRPVGYEDYPSLSRRLNEEGDVRISYTITAKGKVGFCEVVKSSGFRMLDVASCQVTRRWQFYMPKDASMPIQRYFRNLAWRLDDPDGTALAEDMSGRWPIAIPEPTRGVNVAEPGELPSGMRANIGLSVKVSPSGVVDACSVRWGSGNSKLDMRTCSIVFAKWNYRPVLKNGVPVRAFKPETFFWAAPDAAVPHISKGN
jgi:TonB family protein